jgi:predicted enzyme related to lactoylglutathione lyase
LKKKEIMPNNVKHFAVHADDVERAQKFYETVFGWKFKPWGANDRSH